MNTILILLLYLAFICNFSRPCDKFDTFHDLLEHIFVEEYAEKSVFDIPTAQGVKQRSGVDMFHSVKSVLAGLEALGVKRGSAALVVYGSQKELLHLELFITALMGHYTFIPISNYMDFESSLEVVFQSVEETVFAVFSWDIYFSLNAEYLTKIQRSHQVSLISNDGFYGVSTVESSRVTWDELISKGRSITLGKFSGNPRELHRISGRNNNNGVLELLRMEVDKIYFHLKSNCGHADSSKIDSSIVIAPMNSPDINEHVMQLLPMRRMYWLEGSWADVPYLLQQSLDAPKVVGASHAQWKTAMRTFDYHSYLLGDSGALEWWRGLFRPRLCVSGGGAISPDIRHFVSSVMCATVSDGLQLSWACAEVEGIAFDRGHGYFLLPQNEYELESFGPYKSSNKEGILLVHQKPVSKASPPHIGMSLHQNIVNERWVTIDTKKYYRTGDIVQLSKASGRVKVNIVDKVTFPFRIGKANNRWIRVGLIEKTIEDDQSVVKNAAVFGSYRARDESIVLVVFLANSRMTLSTTEVLNHARSKLQTICESSPWEIPTSVHITDEPWEWRPRKKIRNILKKKFESPVNRINPGAIPLSNEVNFQPGRHIYERCAFDGAEVSYEVWADQVSIIRVLFFAYVLYKAIGAPVPVCSIVPQENKFSCSFPLSSSALSSGDYFGGSLSKYFILDVLTGCDFFREQSTADGIRFRFPSCLLRDADGVLKEPEARGRFYHPDDTLDFRLNRNWEDIPWQLWDHRDQYGFDIISFNDMQSQLDDIIKIETRLTNIIPKLVPSLGYLHDVGIRFSRRLDMLKRLFQNHAHLIFQEDRRVRFEAVTKLVLPQMISVPPPSLSIHVHKKNVPSQIAFDEFVGPKEDLDAVALGRRYQILMTLGFFTWLLFMYFAFRIFFPSNMKSLQPDAEQQIFLSGG